MISAGVSLLLDLNARSCSMLRGYYTFNIVSLVVITALQAFAQADSHVIHVLTDADFDQVTAEGTWLIEFFAPW